MLLKQKKTSFVFKQSLDGNPRIINNYSKQTHKEANTQRSKHTKKQTDRLTNKHEDTFVLGQIKKIPSPLKHEQLG